LNTCRICGAEFPPKKQRPNGTLCQNPECQGEARRVQARARYKVMETVPPPLPFAAIGTGNVRNRSGRSSIGRAAPGGSATCACGAPTARIYSCETCFAAMTWAVTQGIVAANKAVVSGLGGWENEPGYWLVRGLRP